MEHSDPVRAQYEAFPYPERDPAEERVRLITGSPSHPLEVDHVLFGGRRDWAQPFRALVAGGGTGDALVMLAAKLAEIGCPAELVYLDLSRASRAVAEARMAERGLTAEFVTGDLLEAPSLGPFDYIDCCGVLHHLEDPDAGLAALGRALAPEGGMGLMVYAPFGRTGVYPLQEAFAALLPDEAPRTRLAVAKTVLRGLPKTNWLAHNPFVGDHKVSDAGIYDLLLHGRDQPFTIEAFVAALERAGLGLVCVTEPARYDPLRYLPADPSVVSRVRALGDTARMALAERLSGAMKTHVVYAAPAPRAGHIRPPGPGDTALVPHLRADPSKLAARIAEQGAVSLTLDGVSHRIDLAPPVALAAKGARDLSRCRAAFAPLVAAMDGRRTLGEIRRNVPATDRDVARVFDALTDFNLLHLSAGARP